MGYSVGRWTYDEGVRGCGELGELGEGAGGRSWRGRVWCGLGGEESVKLPR